MGPETPGADAASEPTAAQHQNELLDEALTEGFPASDPVAIGFDDRPSDPDRARRPGKRPAVQSTP